MTEEDDLRTTIGEWSRSLDRTAMPEARAAFLSFMSGLGFTFERYVGDDEELATIFRYIDDDGVPVLCGDWMATLTHVFTRRNWKHLEPEFKVSITMDRPRSAWESQYPEGHPPRNELEQLSGKRR